MQPGQDMLFTNLAKDQDDGLLVGINEVKTRSQVKRRKGSQYPPPSPVSKEMLGTMPQKMKPARAMMNAMEFIANHSSASPASAVSEARSLRIR